MLFTEGGPRPTLHAEGRRVYHLATTNPILITRLYVILHSEELVKYVVKKCQA
jgi:hypothetical protein